jgi:peptidoglycan/xylan/chitin deacetylase (PgdA/CDA1 family)
MKLKISAALMIAFFLASPLAAQIKPQRYVAITIDDLPVVSTRKDLANRQEITKKILGHIAKAKIPVIGFVNENKLYKNAKDENKERDEQQIDLLRQWMNAGLELGNHTFWHDSLNKIDLKKYEDEIVQGEIITKELMKEKGKTERFFRHPYLQTGLNMQVKVDLNKFLDEHGYTIAPVSIDNGDWIFASAYDQTFDKNDTALMKKVGAAYVPYMNSKVDYWEHQSDKIFGREIKQILLIHANFINSDYLDDLIKMFKKRGYTFITLEDALKDEAYKLPDNFIKNSGISWLHRWALDKGKNYLLDGEPEVPKFVMKAAGVDSE